ncbi:MAG: hypothetical protein ACRDYA_18510 [Egibacteraceae bacterium]
MALVRAWDPGERLAIVPLDHPCADRLVGHLEHERRYGSMHLVTPDGCIHSAGDAIAATATYLDGAGWVGTLHRRSPAVRRLIARGYELVSEQRGSLSNLVRDRPPVVRPPKEP